MKEGGDTNSPLQQDPMLIRFAITSVVRRFLRSYPVKGMICLERMPCLRALGHVKEAIYRAVCHECLSHILIQLCFFGH
jgi:hypothetical protein